MKKLILIASHLGMLVFGFALGVYALPILIAPPPPSAEELAGVKGQALFTTEFVRDLPGSDGLHWGEGRVDIAPRSLSFEGKLAPGPDYRLYFSPQMVVDETSFLAAKASMRMAGSIRRFEDFTLELPLDLDPADYRAVVVWCETFGEFITAGAYR